MGLLDKPVLITGGAGYIGSHAMLALREAGRRVVDDLSTGRRGAVPDGVPFFHGKVEGDALIGRIISEHGCRSIMHFAGSIVVPDSVARPLDYYHNNVVASARLLRTCVDSGIDRFVFSSTAAVYDGDGPDANALAEGANLDPASPYGRTKLMTEWMLADIAAAHDLRFAVLRYFNVADGAGRSGQYSKMATHLIKRACQVALGALPYIDFFGADYPTPDGTCVRDYIHITDLAQAHVAVLDHICETGQNVTLNCGYGRGYSVAEVLDMVDHVAADMVGAAPMVRRPAPRRPDDPASLIANSARLRQTIDWQPRFDDLSVIVASALAWEIRLLDGSD